MVGGGTNRRKERKRTTSRLQNGLDLILLGSLESAHAIGSLGVHVSLGLDEHLHSLGVTLVDGGQEGRNAESILSIHLEMEQKICVEESMD